MADKKYISEMVGQKLWVKAGDDTWCYDVLDLAYGGSRRRKGHGGTPEKILSLMPGKITKVFVKPGDAVTKGQPLLVMEAMKMEYTLKADFVTEVEEVKVSVGNQVSLGELLIQLRKDTSGEKA